MYIYRDKCIKNIKEETPRGSRTLCYLLRAHVIFIKSTSHPQEASKPSRWSTTQKKRKLYQKIRSESRSHTNTCVRASCTTAGGDRELIKVVIQHDTTHYILQCCSWTTAPETSRETRLSLFLSDKASTFVNDWLLRRRSSININSPAVAWLE